MGLPIEHQKIVPGDYDFPRCSVCGFRLDTTRTGTSEGLDSYTLEAAANFSNTAPIYVRSHQQGRA
jgi:hypothetical protein